MNSFEYVGNELHHFIDGVLVAVVAAENVAAYQSFVPEAPLPAPAGDAGQFVPAYLQGHVELTPAA